MANDDADWVADVRRWYFAGALTRPMSHEAGTDESAPLGYEAADPALQSRHWPDAPRDAITEPR